MVPTSKSKNKASLFILLYLAFESETDCGAYKWIGTIGISESWS